MSSYIFLPINVGMSDEQAKKILSFPIVGISYQQAMDFCKWRTDIEKRRGSPFKIRLLSIKEFKKYNQLKDSISVDSCSNFNYKGMKICKNGYFQLPDLKNGIMQIASFRSNAFGLYEMSGNVSEIVYEKDSACGGNFDEKAIQALKCKTFIVPNSSTGFRTIAYKIGDFRFEVR